MSEQVDAFLEHHGVKGMHWGVHRQRLLELHTRVANGTANRREKLHAASQMSAIDIAKHKGSVTSYSRQQAERLQAQKDRVQSGHGTARDRIGLATSVTGEDVVRKVIGKPRKDKEPAFHSDLDELLEHHGVKGMHWGVRKEHVTGDQIRGARYRQKQAFDRAGAAESEHYHATSARGRQIAQKHFDDAVNDYESEQGVAGRRTGAEKVTTVLAVAAIGSYSAILLSGLKK